MINNNRGLSSSGLSMEESIRECLLRIPRPLPLLPFYFTQSQAAQVMSHSTNNTGHNSATSPLKFQPKVIQQSGFDLLNRRNNYSTNNQHIIINSRGESFFYFVSLFFLMNFRAN